MPDVPNVTNAADDATTAAWLANLDRAVRAGLPLEQERRLQCLTNVKYYRLRGHEDIQARPAESEIDFRERPKLSLPFTRRVVNVLATKLYSPGPGREVAKRPDVTKWLERTYKQCHADTRWQRADVMQHLNGMCAIQVGATGDPDRPLTMQLWSGWHEIVPYEHPGRANEVAAVVTIDAEDQTTTYTLWTPQVRRVYRTEKLRPGQTAGGRTAELIEDGPNPYGVLPFAFKWFEPLDGGVDAQVGLGPHLVRVNRVIDRQRSDMAQAVAKHHIPILTAKGVDVDALQVQRTTGVLHIEPDVLDAKNPVAPELAYLQSHLDIAGGIEYVRHVIDTELEALGLPMTAWRLDAGTLPSGEALIQEQAPMLEYAAERRPGFQGAEADLARVCLQVAGAYYGAPELAAAAEDLELVLTWPPVTLNLPSQARDDQDNHSVAAGFESRVQVVMRRFGFSRDQAEKHLEQVAKDEAWLASIGLAAPPAAAEAANAPPADPAGDPAPKPPQNPTPDDETDEPGDDQADDDDEY